jgi:aminopeptidase YwaD
VNAFPGKMKLQLNGVTLVPGQDYLIDAASSGYKGNYIEVEKKDLGQISNIGVWMRLMATYDKDKVWLLENTDTFCKVMDIKPRDLPGLLPKGCFILPEDKKLTWTVSQEPIDATVFHVTASAIPEGVNIASVNVRQRYLANAGSENIVACVPGKIADSFIVFSAHYDHLGEMGYGVVFPGASDNASGTAMLLYLAEYYSRHPQKYTMVFMAFSGEEAGLMGSDYFVKNPLIQLSHIKFLTNVDIMGDATDGVTVVNATEHPAEFSMLTKLNEEQQFIPAVKSRGKAANSDHYRFSEKGVPAFFIYSNGGKGHYHDIYDTADEITLNKVPGVAALLINFVEHLQQ